MRTTDLETGCVKSTETGSVTMTQSIGAKALFKITAKIAIVLALVACAFVAVRAQTAPSASSRLRLDSLERLAPKANETVNVDVDGFLIKFASVALSDDDPDEKNIKAILAGLKGVYVRSYGFKAEGAFSDADIAPVREQLRAPAWKRLVDVKSRGAEAEDAEIYVATDGDHIEGMAIIAVEPMQITVVNIVGSIDIDKIKKIEGSLGIPRIHIERKREGARKGEQ